LSNFADKNNSLWGRTGKSFWDNFGNRARFGVLRPHYHILEAAYMARPRKAAAVLELAGSFKKDPARRRSNPTARGSIGAWRDGSSDPAQIWSELVHIAPEGVLTSADRPALQAAAFLIARMRANPGAVTPAAVTCLVGTLSKLGMSPAGRVALEIAPPPAEEPNPFTEFLEPLR
jgi:hypothetical protein